MRFDPRTGELLPESTKRNNLSLWRAVPNEKWYLSTLLFPFRLLFSVIRITYNSIIFIFKNFSALIAKIIMYGLFIVLIWPFKTIIYVVTFGKIKILKHWLESWRMRIDFWKNRGYLQ